MNNSYSDTLESYLIPAFEKEKDQFLEKLKEVIKW